MRSRVVLLVLVAACGSGAHFTDAAPAADAPRADANAPTIDATAPDGSLGPCTKPTNRALSFSGGQLVRIADAPSLRPADMTLEAWAEFSAVPGFGVVVTKPFGTGTQDSFVIWYQNGQLLAGANPTSTGDAIGETFAPTLGQWYHFAFTFDHTTQAQILYVDGVEVASGTSTSVVQYDTNPVQIGADLNFGGVDGFWQGDIDEVKLWSSVRDVTDVGLDMHSCTPGTFSGLGGYWALDEGSGQTTADLSGNDNVGTLGADTTAAADDPAWVDSTVPF